MLKEISRYIALSFIPLPAFVMLYACAGIPVQNANTVTFATVSYTCASATAALKTSIVLNAKLTPANRAAVTQAGQVLNPICSQDPVPTVSTVAYAALTVALGQLTAAAAQAQK